MPRPAICLAVGLAFGGLAFPNPFPFLLVAGLVLLVGGAIHERREGR